MQKSRKLHVLKHIGKEFNLKYKEIHENLLYRWYLPEDVDYDFNYCIIEFCCTSLKVAEGVGLTDKGTLFCCRRQGHHLTSNTIEELKNKIKKTLLKAKEIKIQDKIHKMEKDFEY